MMDLAAFRREVVEKLKAWSPPFSGSPRLTGRDEGTTGKRRIPPREFELCTIGASTGGPRAIHQILEALPATFPVPIVIVQHMPVGFTKPFAERLNSVSPLQVSEARDGDALLPGRVLLARAGVHLRVTNKLSVVLTDLPREAKHIPSVDVAMKSAARACPGRVLGVLLTGMGDDGAHGMAAIRISGGYTIAESEASCAVYGMPRAAQLLGAVDSQLSLSEITQALQGLSAIGAETRLQLPG
jgi:two-component system chemotaxis response regulator CheB